MKTIIIILTAFILPLSLTAQDVQFQQEQFPFPITFNGFSPHLGFTAAASYYHHDFGDLDSDGDFDILMCGGFSREYYFENTGSATQDSFRLISHQYINPQYNELFQTPCFCDIDNDLDIDIFVGIYTGNINYFENIGTPDSAVYALADSNFQNIDIGENPVLDFIDIDNDNDFDLFVGAGYPYSVDGKVYYYENVGTAFEPEMTLITNNFEGIDVDENASPEFCDIDDDSDYDLFVGSEDGIVWFYENIGSPELYDFEYVTNYYFEIDVGTDAVPRFCDIDNDGDFDLFVANESVGFTTDVLEGDISFYENIGTVSEPQFQFVTGQYLYMDVSAYSAPTLEDIDNDGLLEMFTGVTDGEIIYFENSGTETEPNFYLFDSAFCDLDLPYQTTLGFGDLDNDSDLDFIVSRSGATSLVDVYQNIGNSSFPDYTQSIRIQSSVDTSYSGIDLVDIDADNDLDLFIGGDGNNIQYWENIGSASIPQFVMINYNYFNDEYIWASKFPRFSDLDHDGDYDAIIGDGKFSDDWQNLVFWRNTGSPSNPNFVAEDTIATFEPATVMSLRPALGDVDGDGDDDIIVGEMGGSFLFFRNLEFGGGSDIELILTPHNTPIQIQPGGGFFTFDVEVENVSTTNYVIDFITDATLPNGNHYPILQRSNISLIAGATIIRNDLTQAVPGNAPVGDYSYNAYVRDNVTQDTLAVDSFDFEKVESMGIDDPWIFDWGLFGWDEEVSLNNNDLPESFSLSAYPNPFNAETTIKLQIPDDSKIAIKIFNTTGQEVAVLKDGHVNAGYHQIRWNAIGFSSGIYLIHLDTHAGYNESRKVMLLK